MTARIDALTPRLESLREMARQALAAHYRFLEALALEELEARRARLDAYQLQARFSLAAVYDRAASASTQLPAPTESDAALARQAAAEIPR